MSPLAAGRGYRGHMPRLSVNINDETANALRSLAVRRVFTITETTRRAVSLLVFLLQAKRDGKHIRLVAADGTMTYVEFP